MPTYAYRCSACEHEFDAVQSFHDDPLTLCPSCGAAAARRVFRSVGVIFKGSGWYINDTRKDRKRGASTAPKDDAPDTTDTTEAPAAKGDAAGAPAAKDAAPSEAAKDAPAPAGASSNASRTAAPTATS